MRSNQNRATLFLAILVVGLLVPQAGAAQDASQPSPSVPPSESSPYPLEGAPWRLVGHRWLDQQRATAPEVVARASFVDGRIRGSGGCNLLTGTYSQKALAISTEVSSRTGRSCAEQTMLVERALLHGLDVAATFRILPGAEPWQAELRISDEFGNEQLRFRVDDAGALTVGEWRLESYTVGGLTTSADPDQRSVLAFVAARTVAVTGRVSGDLVGSSGCNGIVAAFSQHGSVLSIARIERTRAPCEPAIAAQEEALLSILDATAMTLELPPGRLALTSADGGDRLDFTNSHPLEDNTWLLARLPDGSAARGEVTLRLDDGIVSGEGPCGSYSGRYETNGVLIRIGGLASVDGACPDVEAARRYLSALRRTRFADLTQPTLRLRDRFGATTVRFRGPGRP
jgi:heat shock protein HslJ